MPQLAITKRGKPVARLVPVDEAQPSIFGRMNGTGKILGDVVESTGENWSAESADGW